MSQLRNFWDTVDLEELPDSRGRTGAPVLWRSCEGQINVLELFSDNSYLSAILDRQGLSVADPVDLRTKKTESFSPQLSQDFWPKLKNKNPKIVVLSHDRHYRKLEAKRSHVATVPFMLGRGRKSNSWW